MRNFLSTAIMLNWAVLFGLLAIAWSADLKGGGLNVLALLSIGGASAVVHASGPLLAGCGAVVLGVIATLFLWAALAFMFGPASGQVDYRRIAATALGTAMFALIALTAAGFVVDGAGWPVLPACGVLALLVCLVVTAIPVRQPAPPVRHERRNASAGARIVDFDTERAARLLAMPEPQVTGRRPVVQTEWL